MGISFTFLEQPNALYCSDNSLPNPTKDQENFFFFNLKIKPEDLEGKIEDSGGI